MRRGLARGLLMSGIGAGCGALAAWIAYMVREPEEISLDSLDTTVLVDEMTISDQTWAIVGLTLLGALVCGSISAVYVSRKGPARVAMALLVAVPVGAAMCWGARWAMDALIYRSLGGPEARVDLLRFETATFVPWIVWEVGIAVGLTLPIVIAVGPNKYTVIRGLIGAAFVIVFGKAVEYIAVLFVIAFAIGIAVSGSSDITSLARTIDVMYLFFLGAGAGIAFAVAEAVYKPAWLKSFRGASEGRTWTLSGPVARIGSMEGVEVYLPPDGTVAPVHAQVHAQDDAHFVADVVGGTTVNGAPTQTTWLNDGDRIGVGSAVLIYRTRLNAPVKEQPRVATVPVKQVALLDPMGNRHVLLPGVNVVGREVGCHVALTWEPSVSRRHAEVVVAQQGVTVRDLGSTNGTYVQGQRVGGEAQVANGAEVVFGRCKTTLES